MPVTPSMHMLIKIFKPAKHHHLALHALLNQNDVAVYGDHVIDLVARHAAA